MNVVFRVDSSPLIGMGHLVRTLVLARLLRLQGAKCDFICRDHSGHQSDLVQMNGFAVHLLPMYDTAPAFSATDYTSWLGASAQADALETVPFLQDKNGLKTDWLVVDHYGASSEWQRALRPHCRHLMVIDDHASGIHDCDVLLNQGVIETENLSALHASAHVSLVLLGPQYALLAPEFSLAWQGRNIRYQSVKRVLVAFGGADPLGLSLPATRACLAVWPQAHVDVILGAASRNRSVLEDLARHDLRVRLHVAVKDVCSLMLGADFSLGAAGMMSWERCATGLPAALVALADNQEPILEYLSSQGAAVHLGEAHHLDVDKMVAALLGHKLSAAKLADMSHAALGITDGQGALRVAAAMKEFE